MNDIKIESLMLSARSANALHRAGILRVDQLIQLTEDDIYNIRNMGTKSVAEVLEVIEKIKNGDIVIFEDMGSDNHIIFEEEGLERITEEDMLVAWAHSVKVVSLENVFFLQEGVAVEDLYIDELYLSNRSYNAMAQNGYLKLSSICRMTMKELLRIRNLGKKSIDEIIHKIALHTGIEGQNNNSFQAERCLETVLKCFEGTEYKADLPSIKLYAKQVLSTEEVAETVAIYEKEPDIHIKDLLEFMMQEPYFINLLEVHIIGKLAKLNRAVVKDFAEIFPHELVNYCSDILQMMVEKKKILYLEGKYEIAYKSFKEWIESLEDGRNKTFIERKARGETLEGIGDDYGLTRERVRQIIAKQLKKRPRLKEDKFTWLYEKYALDKEKVMRLFNLDAYAYEYYCMVTKKSGQKDYLGIMNEDDVPLYVKSNVEAYRYKDCIDVNGEKIEKNRNSILQYILRSKCRDEVTLDELKKFFDELLMEYDLEDDEDYQYPERYFETKLANKPDVLWKHGKKLRYFVMSDDDFEELLQDIQFEELQDVEISTRYFFLKYPDVMELYDIRDANELHNLMKKHMSDTNIDFNRMPHIGIGNYDRDMQVLNLLLEYAPIHYEELAKIYEERYGVEAKTATSVHFMCISEYVHDGIYSVDYEELTREEYDALTAMLTDDIYELSQIKKEFIQRVPYGDVKKLNDYNLKKLGYKISVNVIYHVAKYKHIDTYFKETILKQDIIDMNPNPWIMRNQVLYNLIWQMKNEYQLIEFAPLKYISIHKLEEQGIGKADIIDFCIAACEFVNGRYFTVHSLKKNGFSHELFELGFEDYFYISVLRYFPGCSYVRAGTRSNALFREEGQADFRELLENIIIQKGSMDIYDLLDYIGDEYGIVTDKWKLTAWVRESNLYYSETMEKVYLDYDQFYEEV